MKTKLGVEMDAHLYSRSQAHAGWVFDKGVAGTRIGAEEYFSAEDLDRQYLRWTELRALWPAAWGVCGEAGLIERKFGLWTRRQLTADIRVRVRAELALAKRAILAKFGLQLLYYKGEDNWGPFEEPFETEEELVDLLVCHWADLDLNRHLKHAKDWTRAVARYEKLGAAAWVERV